MAEESVDDDYKNIIDDIIKNEDEDKLNSLVKEANLDSSLIDYILLNGEEIEEWGDYGSLVCHKDLNLANKRSIIDHEGDLFICDNNGKNNNGPALCPSVSGTNGFSPPPPPTRGDPPSWL